MHGNRILSVRTRRASGNAKGRDHFITNRGKPKNRDIFIESEPIRLKGKKSDQYRYVEALYIIYSPILK